MNLIKSKLRNKMKLDLLNNILHIRFGLKRLGVCYNTYTLPDDILKLIDTIRVYEQKTPESLMNKNDQFKDLECLLL